MLERSTWTSATVSFIRLNERAAAANCWRLALVVAPFHWDNSALADVTMEGADVIQAVRYFLIPMSSNFSWNIGAKSTRFAFWNRERHEWRSHCVGQSNH